MFCSILDEIHQRWNRLGARNLQSMRTRCAAVCVSLQFALTSKLLARDNLFPKLSLLLEGLRLLRRYFDDFRRY